MEPRQTHDARAIELMTRWTLLMLQNAERGLIPVKKLERFVDPSVLAALGPITPRPLDDLPLRPQVGHMRIQIVHDDLAHVACVAGRPDGGVAGYVLECRREAGEHDWHITELTRAEERLLVSPNDKRYTLRAERRLPRHLSGLIATTERARGDAEAALERAEAEARELRDRIAELGGSKSARRIRERRNLRDEERHARLTAARWKRAIQDIDKELRELREVAELREARKLVAERDPLMAVRNPQHLERLLGPIPNEREGRKAWRRAASAVERYRQRWNVTDPEHALGHPPANAEVDRRQDYSRAAEAAKAYSRGGDAVRGHSSRTPEVEVALGE